MYHTFTFNILSVIQFFSITLLSICFSIVQAQENEDWRDYQWQQKKDDDGIKIYTANVKKSRYDAVYGSMIVKAPVNNLVALVKDPQACSQWADLCKESRVEKKISELEYFVYTYNDVPFPVTDRDIVAKVNWTQTSSTLAVVMTAEPIAGIVEKTNAVRIEEADSRWYFTPLQNGKTKVETFAHVNPNGPMPAWLINMLIVSSPFKTMKGMRNIVEGGAYANSKSIFTLTPTQ